MDIISIENFKGKHVHFIGIGGASMNGLAILLKEQGYQVSGSNNQKTAFLPHLDENQISYHIGHQQDYVKDADLVVYTAAIKADNVEYAYAKTHGIPMMERSVLLGQILSFYPRSIAIAGCHGKTTVSSMIGQILIEAQLDPSIHIGASVEYLDHGGTHLGESDIFVAEACEYLDSFLHFYPYMALINNIDDDHLDYFPNIDAIMKSFEVFLSQVQKDGVVFGNLMDEKVMSLLEHIPQKVVTYGIEDDADYSATNLVYDDDGCASFTAMHKGQALFTTQLTLPGEYNVLNAIGAVAVCHTLGAASPAIGVALAKYESAQRRFKLQAVVDGVEVYHDYAHHPTAVASVIGAAKMHHHHEVWVVFECDSFARLESFFERFKNALSGADHVIVAKVYPSRGKTSGKVDGQDLTNALQQLGTDAMYIPEYDDIAKYLKTHWQKGDIVLALGSGTIDQNLHKIIE